MKRAFFLFFILSLTASCNLPQQVIVTEVVDSTSTDEVILTATIASTPTPTLTPLTPIQTPTSTPIPCDPVSAEYCITEGNFLFQRPILPPDNDKVDITYLYATTQNGARDPHHGVEFQNPFGTQVHAAGEGNVVFADSDKATKFSPWNNFYGNVVVIQHANEVYTLYAHLSSIAVVIGQSVQTGDAIGQVGATGGATGPHLHFEVRVGGAYTDYFSTQNPELWLIPQSETGALSITFKSKEERNVERPIVITRLADSTDDGLFTYYLTSYAKGLEHNPEDAVLNSLPAGRYKIAFNDSSGLRERIVMIEAGKLTETLFEIK